jgi:CBS-domain-containing membrane protein
VSKVSIGGFMSVFDKKLKGHISQYILQCLIATGALGLVLTYMDIFLNTTMVASIGATSFIIFTMPHTHRSGVRYILGGYAVGAFVGVIFNLFFITNTEFSVNIIGALAVGLAMFIMVITNTEHPPAAALALGITIQGFSVEILVFVFGVTSFLLFIKWLLRKWLIDLL